jgi:hypothetical protein
MPILRRLGDLAELERAELEATLAAHRAGDKQARFVSDEGDFFAFLLLLFLAAAGGLVAILLEQSPAEDFFELYKSIRGGYFGVAIFVNFFGPFFLVLLGLAAWAARTVARMHKRCGVALLSSGVARVRGGRLAFLRFADVKAHGRRDFTMGKSDHRHVSAVELTMDDDKRVTLYAFAGEIADAVAAAKQA